MCSMWHSFIFSVFCFFFFNDTATTEIYTLSLHDALPISPASIILVLTPAARVMTNWCSARSEEHTSELQSRGHLVCRLLLEKKKYKIFSRIGDKENTISDSDNCFPHCFVVLYSLFFLVFHYLFLLHSMKVSNFFFFNDTATTEIYTLSLHDALPI